MKKRYTFTTTQGRICCAADDPALLCSRCRRQAAPATTKRGHKLRVARPKALRPYSQAIEARQGRRDVIRDRHGSPKPYSTALAWLRGETDDQTTNEVVTTKSGAPLPYSLALRRRAAEVLKARQGGLSRGVIRDKNGTPRPYTTALKRRASAAR